MEILSQEMDKIEGSTRGNYFMKLNTFYLINKIW